MVINRQKVGFENHFVWFLAFTYWSAKKKKDWKLNSLVKRNKEMFDCYYHYFQIVIVKQTKSKRLNNIFSKRQGWICNGNLHFRALFKTIVDRRSPVEVAECRSIISILFFSCTIDKLEDFAHTFEREINWQFDYYSIKIMVKYMAHVQILVFFEWLTSFFEVTKLN